MNVLSSLRIKIRELFNPLLSPYRLNKLSQENVNFTLLSNNCWGGHVYRYFNLPYNTPTIGMYFFIEDYIKFLSKLEYYLSLDIRIIHAECSRHYQEILREHKDSLYVPIGVLDDVEIVFLHSHSDDEARDSWNRRKARMNLDNLVVKMSEMNGCSLEYLRIFDALPYKKKIVFTTKDYGLKSQIIFKDYLGEEQILNDTLNFRKYVNLENLINGLPCAINQ